MTTTMKKNHKNINEICQEIDLIIKNKDNKIDYKFLYSDLKYALLKKIDYSEIVTYCNTVLLIAKTKNRILRHLESDFWDFIIDLPFQLLIIQRIEVSENEEIDSNTDYANQGKKILSRLIGLSKEILDLPDDNSKGSELRRAKALRLIAEMINYYDVKDAKNLFLNSIKSKNTAEQYSALEGLENYYDATDDEISDELVKVLNEIIENTDDRTVASTCLQILINAAIIDEMTAICEIDDWEDDHLY
jgi:hypothetical protein